jgi:hypothetical protein
MPRGNGIIVMRAILAGLIALLGLYSLTHGRLVAGILLLAIAAVSATITVSIHRRRKMIGERFPGLAERRRQGRFAGRANMGPWGSEPSNEPYNERSSGQP